MTIEDIKRDEKFHKEGVPLSGQLLAYTRGKVLFSHFSCMEDVEEILKDLDLLELHLFNDKAEYRCVSSRRHDMISVLEDFPRDDTEHVYEETCLLDNDTSKITVLNHLCYNDDNGMAVIDGYRLIMEA